MPLCPVESAVESAVESGVDTARFETRSVRPITPEEG